MRRVSEISNYPGAPISVLRDVNQRITDWVASGGSEEDLYVQRQIEYVEQVYKRIHGSEN